MTSILLAENTREDGSIKDEDEFGAAAATLFIGEFTFSSIRSDFGL